MNVGIFAACETEVARFPRFLCREENLNDPAFCKDAGGVFRANEFVHLEQVEAGVSSLPCT